MHFFFLAIFFFTSCCCQLHNRKTTCGTISEDHKCAKSRKAKAHLKPQLQRNCKCKRKRMSANHQIIHTTFLPAGILVIKESSSHYESSKVLNYCGRIRRLLFDPLFGSDQLSLCCSFASSLCDRRHRDQQLHQPFVQLQLPVWGRSLCATPSRSPCPCINLTVASLVNFIMCK